MLDVLFAMLVVRRGELDALANVSRKARVEVLQ